MKHFRSILLLFAFLFSELVYAESNHTILPLLREELISINEESKKINRIKTFLKEELVDLSRQEVLKLLEELFSWDVVQNNNILKLEVGNYIASYYSRIGQSDACLEMYFSLLPLSKQVKPREYYSMVHTGIGHEYFYLGDYEKALKFFQSSHENNLKYRDSSTIAGSYINIGTTFSRISETDSAIHHIEKGLEIYTALRDTVKIATTLNNLGSVYHRQLEHTEIALNYFKEALDLLSKVSNPYQEGITTMNIGVLLFELEDKDLAIEYMQRALRSGKQLDNIPLYKLSLQNLMQMYADLERFDSAYSYQNQYYALNDSLNTAQQKSVVRDLEEQFAADQLEKEKQIKDLRIKQLYYGILISSLVILLLLLMAYQIYRRKKMKEVVATMKSNFYAYLTHEFRTPISLIKSPAQQIYRNSKDAMVKHNSQLIMKNADELLHLFNQLLDITKLENHAYIQQQEYGDVVAHIEAQIEKFQPLAAQKNITLTFYEPNNRIKTTYSADILQKVFQNVLSNAIKFSFENSKVEIVLSEEEKNGNTLLKLSVRDYGKGLSDDAATRIFDKYQSFDKSINPEGVGLGLSLSKELLQLIGGDINLVLHKDEGCEFIIRMPLQGLPETAKKETNQESQFSILLVDDNTEILQFLKQELSSYYTCHVAVNGKDALETAKKNLPDIILSDVMMPVMDGMELVAKLKENELTEHIPIILLSAKSSAVAKQEGLKTGAITYISKPFDIEEIKQLISNYLKWTAALHAKYSVYSTPKNNEHNGLLGNKHAFIVKCIEIIASNLEDSSFGVNELAEALCLSRAQVHRKIKALTGLSTTGLIRNTRLEHAHVLLQTELDINVSEAAYKTGFSSLSYFSKSYSAYFGKQPSSVK
jgi:signal transduction histidine kinase/response regulator of citrate/malate metabolism